VTPYDAAFTGETMRVDYLQTGGRGIEAVALDRIVNDGPWPGSRTNLVDETMVTDGSVNFNTIFQGKFRLIQTRASQGLSTTELDRINDGAGVNITGTKTSFIVLPGAVAMAQLTVPDPTEIFRNANTYKGGGSTSIWHRWGYVLAPAGYDWVGAEDAFPDDAAYKAVIESTTQKALESVTDTTGSDNTVGVWNRKFTSALSLGILPVFHS